MLEGIRSSEITTNLLHLGEMRPITEWLHLSKMRKEISGATLCYRALHLSEMQHTCAILKQ